MGRFGGLILRRSGPSLSTPGGSFLPVTVAQGLQGRGHTPTVGEHRMGWRAAPVEIANDEGHFPMGAQGGNDS